MTIQLNSGVGDIIARAMTLASTGDYPSIAEIKTQLKAEGFERIDAHFSGPSLRREINGRIAKARG